ncbi:MAG TPA: SGNH/GDSL hydrolase family protein [Polyangiaceae bacterium]|nr:SGNH/GDSL hydrolase family protein [Polyangiaceae bacterium]
MRWSTATVQALVPAAVAAAGLSAVWLLAATPGARADAASVTGSAPPAAPAADTRPPTRAAPTEAPPGPDPAGLLRPAAAGDDAPAPIPGPLGAAPVPAIVPSAPVVVAALGDSLTDARSHGGAYLAPITERCPRSRVENHGKGADMVNQMRRRFLRDILPSATPFTHLVVFGGVNDLYSDETAGRSPEKVARDLLDIFSQARQRGMRVVALTVAPWGGFKRYFNAKRAADTRRLNAWIREQFADGTVDHVVDAYALLSCGNPDYLCRDYSIDGIHFNAKGHAVLGAALFDTAFTGCQ